MEFLFVNWLCLFKAWKYFWTTAASNTFQIWIQKRNTLRLNYPNSMGDRELVSSLTKVWSHATISSRTLIRTKCTTTPTKGTSQLWTSFLGNKSKRQTANNSKPKTSNNSKRQTTNNNNRQTMPLTPWDRESESGNNSRTYLGQFVLVSTIVLRKIKTRHSLTKACAVHAFHTI